MKKVFFLTSAVLAMTFLSGCTVAPKRDTYDAIRAQLAPKPASAAPLSADDAVSNALLPPVAALAVQLPRARPVLDERFNVSFNNVPAAQFFASIVSGTRYNMLVDPKVEGSITANLKDVTLFEALDAVRDLYGYEYSVSGSRITIKPLTLQTSMFQVNYLIGNRRGSSSLRVMSTSISNTGGSASNSNSSNSGSNSGSNNNNTGSAGAQGNSSDVSTTSANDFWGELRVALDTIVGGKENGRSVVISPQSGVIVVRAMPDEMRNVDRYLRATQLSVERQVILEAKILEVELNDSFQSGVNWAGFASSGANRLSSAYLASGTTATIAAGAGASMVATPGELGTGSVVLKSLGTGSLFGLALQTSNFSTLISFLESQGTVHVLSSPRIATLNNQKALLKIGTDEFFVTGVTTTTTSSAVGNTVTPSVTVAPFFSGVVLDVTPQIDAQGNIILHVHPSVSQVSTVFKSVSLGSVAGQITLPVASSATSEMDSVVRGQDGRVVAIGGLMRQSSTADNAQLPGAGDVPVLGGLFRNRAQTNQKRELVVLIKPTIVESANTWDNDLLDANSRIRELDPDSVRRK